jgi:galactokinase
MIVVIEVTVGNSSSNVVTRGEHGCRMTGMGMSGRIVAVIMPEMNVVVRCQE